MIHHQFDRSDTFHIPEIEYHQIRFKLIGSHNFPIVDTNGDLQLPATSSFSIEIVYGATDDVITAGGSKVQPIGSTK